MLLYISLALLIFGNLQGAQAKKCTLPANKLPAVAMFPDLFKITEGSYMFSIEANLPDKTTEYITLFVDTARARSLVRVEGNGYVRSFLAYDNQNEVFIITGDDCTTVNISTAYEREDVHWILKTGQIGAAYFVLGPSALIRAAYNDFQNNREKFGTDENLVPIRDMSCVAWTWCPDEDTTVKFYFTDGTSVKPYGLSGIPVPLRIFVQDKDDKVWDYAFFRMIPKVWAPRLEEVMQVPATKGCERLRIIETAPKFGLKNIYLEVEVIYNTQYTNNKANLTYISSIKYAQQMKSSLRAVHWTPWTNKQNSENIIKPGDDMIKIFSADYVYVMDRTKDVCNVTRSDDPKARMTFPLPDGTNIDDLITEAFNLGETESYPYIGKATERGLPASVFEKTVLSDDKLTKKIITRYYLDESALLDDEFKEPNALLKIVLWVEDAIGDFKGEVTFNVYDFKTHLTHVHELFDVSPCFKNKEDSKWFQLTFPISTFDMEDVIPSLYLLRSNLVDVLQAYDKDESPLRIPKIQVDIDKDYIYATGLMLERPPFMLDYQNNVTSGKDFREDANTQTIGIMTKSDCAKICLEKSTCESFSYCGATCKVLVGKFNKVDNSISNAKCSIYTNDKYPKSVWTMDQLTLKLNSEVGTRSLIVVLPIKDKPEKTMDFVADRLVNNLELGLDGFRQIGDDFSSVFKVYKPGYRLKKGVATMENELSFVNCKSVCAAYDYCESLSYCLGNSECTIGDKHGEDIPSENIEENDQCMVLSRNYAAQFREYVELMVVTNAQKITGSATPEDCAKSCVKETSFLCQSFDLCGGEDARCLLHTHHFNSLTETESLKQSQECRHFSRGYLNEFDSTLNKDMGTNIVGMVVEDVTSEECARLCRQNAEKMPCAGFTHCNSMEEGSSKIRCALRKTARTELYQPNNGCNSFVWKTGPNKNL